MGALTSIPFSMASVVQGQQMADRDSSNQLETGRINKAFYDLSASDALARGQQGATTARMKGDQTIGAQQVGYAASGVDTSSGTPHQAMLDTRLMSELDAAKLQNNAAREAWGIKVRGEQASVEGQIGSQKAKDKAQGTTLSAMGSIFNAGATGGAGFTGGG